MAFGVQIPKSNTLRMVRTDNQSYNLQNFDNRLLNQMTFEDYNDKFYAQKIAGTDTILLQFATDYTTITAKIYNLSDELVIDKTSSISTIQTAENFTRHELSFKFATEGYYYLVLDFDNKTETYQSEVFQIDGFDKDHLLKLEYNTSENDGILYDNDQSFVIRIEGRMVEGIPGQNKESYNNYNNAPSTLNSFPIIKFNLEYGFVPLYMIEKLNLAIAHEVFKVNDVEYFSEEAPDSEIVSDSLYVTNMYKGEVKLQQVSYENYDEAAADVEETIYPILVDEFETVLILKNEETEYYAKYKN